MAKEQLVETRASGTMARFITTGTNISMLVVAHSPVFVHWGDSYQTETGTFSHTYTDNQPFHIITFNTTDTSITFLRANDANLIYFDAQNNPSLTHLLLYNNRLTALDVQNNNKLQWLHVSDNYLTSLDVSNKPDLTTLYCRNNALTSLNITNCPRLTGISIINNPFENDLNEVLAFLLALPTGASPHTGVLYTNPNGLHFNTIKSVAEAKNWVVMGD